MNVIVYTLLAQTGDAAASAADSSGTGGGLMSMLLMLGVFFFLMWFLMIRPRQNEQKKYDQMINGLKIGDRVITLGGFKASITNIVRNKDNEILEFQILLNSSSNVKVMCEPWGIRCLDAAEEDNDKDKDKDK